MFPCILFKPKVSSQIFLSFKNCSDFSITALETLTYMGEGGGPWWRGVERGKRGGGGGVTDSATPTLNINLFYEFWFGKRQETS